jgi:DnaJ-domain-containing protein 1
VSRFRRLGVDEARIIGLALHAIALADGVVDEREVQVLRRFLRDCAAPEADYEGGPVEAETLAAATDGLRDSFLCACAMLAFADGDFTAEEAVLLRRYANWIGVSDAHLEELVRLVEREQALPAVAPPLQSLLDVVGGWSHQQLPSLREKVVRLFFA